MAWFVKKLNNSLDLEDLCENSRSKQMILVARIFTVLMQEYDSGILQILQTDKNAEFHGGTWELLKRLVVPEVMDEYDRLVGEAELDLFKKIFPEKYHKCNTVVFFITNSVLLQDQFNHVKGVCQLNAAHLDVQMEYLSHFDKSTNQLQTETLFPSHGIFLPRIGVFVNHSCEPNLSVSTQYTSKTDWIATKKIVQGEELCISYGFQDEPVKERRILLKEIWGFSCNCPRCSRESGMNLSY